MVLRKPSEGKPLLPSVAGGLAPPSTAPKGVQKVHFSLIPRPWAQPGPAGRPTCPIPSPDHLKSQHTEGILAGYRGALAPQTPLNRSVPRGFASNKHRLGRPKSQCTEVINLQETPSMLTQIPAQRGESPPRNTVYVEPNRCIPRGLASRKRVHVGSKAHLGRKKEALPP